MKCPSCGAARNREDRYCKYCKAAFDPYATVPESKQAVHIHDHQAQPVDPRVKVEYIYTSMEKRSDKSRLLTLLLCLFLGLLGAHKFYLGKYGMGILYLLTLGFCGYGWLIDLFILAFCNPKDKYGNPITWR